MFGGTGRKLVYGASRCWEVQDTWRKGSRSHRSSALLCIGEQCYPVRTPVPMPIALPRDRRRRGRLLSLLRGPAPSKEGEIEILRDSCVDIGTNDDRHCLRGWLASADYGKPRRLGRTIERQGRIALKAPNDASVVGVELWVPPWSNAPYLTWRLTVRDLWVGEMVGPYLDAGVRLQPGRWQTIELPLPVTPAAGSDIELILGVDPWRYRWPSAAARSDSRRRSVTVARAWLRGDWIQPQEVTIVVLNWNRKAETIRCLESLQQADLRGANVLVVDNGSRDESETAIRRRFPEQRVVRLTENRGYSGGNNAGITAALEAGSKAVLLLNNDTQVAADFLEPLLWVLNSDIKAAAVSSAVLRSDYRDALESAYLQVYWGHGIIRHFGVNALPREGFNNQREVEVVVGCSWILSGQALHDVGLLDEAYFAYHEEVDWCVRAHQAGYRVYWQPFSRVWHTKSTSTAELAMPVVGERSKSSGPQLPAAMPLAWNPVQTYLGARNAVRFVRKHASLRRKLYFFASSAYGVPLEFLAAVMRQESALKIGAWTYRKALSLYCANPDAAWEPPVDPVSLWTKVRRLPIVCFRALPRDVRVAREEGRLGQLYEHLRGLWDGLLDRPLPLERLGLR